MGNFHDPNQFTACELYYDCISEDSERQRRGYENLGRYLYKKALGFAATPEDANDLTQITLEKVWLKIEQVRECRAFKSWAKIILYHEWIRRYDKKPIHQELSDTSSNEDSLQKAESSERAIERLFNASLGPKTKWAFIGHLYYDIYPDRDLAAIEGLLCEKSVSASTYPVTRSKYRERWPEMGLVDAWYDAEFWPVDPAEDNALDPTNDDHRELRRVLQQLLITDKWRLLYQAPLEKGERWAWIGLYIYEMSDEELARVENLLCNSRIEGDIMTERRRDTQNELAVYLRKQSFSPSA